MNTGLDSILLFLDRLPTRTEDHRALIRLACDLLVSQHDELVRLRKDKAALERVVESLQREAA